MSPKISTVRRTESIAPPNFQEATFNIIVGRGLPRAFYFKLRIKGGN